MSRIIDLHNATRNAASSPHLRPQGLTRSVRQMMNTGLAFAFAVTGGTGVLLELIGPPTASAQQMTSSSIVRYLGATSSVFSTAPVQANNAGLIALDHQGNMVVADKGRGLVSRVSLSGGSPSTVVSGTPGISAIAADMQGNVFVASTTLDTVVEFPFGSTSPKTVASGLNQPRSLATDVAGDVIIADTGNNQVLAVTPAGSTTTITSSIPGPTALYVDTANDIFVGGTGSLIVIFANQQAQTLGQGWQQPMAITQAGSQDLYVIDAGGKHLTKYAYATGQQQVVLSTTDDISPASVAGDTNGNLYLLNENNSQIQKLDPSLFLGKLQVGQQGPMYTLTFTFDSSDTLAGILGLTQGTADGQLITAGGTCVIDHLYQAGDTCTVAIAAKLTRSGPWNGDVTLIDKNGVDLLDTEVSAQGLAPLQALLPGQAQTYFSEPYSYESELLPTSLAVDAQNNLYVGDDGNEQVLRIAPDGTASIALAGDPTSNSGLKNPLALALDGKGNLYVADQSLAWGVSPNLGSSSTYTPNIFAAIPYGQWGYYQQFVSYMTGLVVQPNGGFFFSDSSNNRVISVDPNSIGTEVLNASVLIGPEQLPLNYPTVLAYEQDGSLLVADLGNARIVRRTVAGETSDVVAPGANIAGEPLVQPMGLAVDPAGNVYISDAGNNRVVGLTPSGSSWVIADAKTLVNGSMSTPLNNPQSLALDTQGNLFIGDMGNERVVKISRTSQSLIFNQTNAGSQSAAETEIQNIGNKSLALQALQVSGSNAFSLLSSTTCKAGEALEPDASCSVELQYAPQTSGESQGQLNITSNTQAISGSVAALPLIGSTEITVDHFRLLNLPANVVAGVPFSFAIRAEDAQNILVTGYRGTVRVQWSEASTPSAQDTFSPSDSGVHTVAGSTMNLAGVAYVTIADVSNPALTVTSQTFVDPGSPASVSVLSGGGQSALLDNAFAQPILVQVTDRFGNLVPGAAVVFTAPASGASAAGSNGSPVITAVTDGTGTAAANVTANGNPGTYAIAVSMQQGGSNSLSLTNLNSGFSMQATPSVTTFDASGNASTTLTITPVAGFSGNISFTCSDASGASCNFSNSALHVQANAATQTGTASSTIPIDVTFASTSTKTSASASNSKTGALLTVCALIGCLGLGRIRRFRSGLALIALCTLCLASFTSIGCLRGSQSPLAGSTSLSTPPPPIQVTVVAQTTLPGSSTIFQRSVLITINPYEPSGTATASVAK